MASTTTTSMATAATTTTTPYYVHPAPPALPKTPTVPRSLRKPATTASTPNLSSAYASHSQTPAHTQPYPQYRLGPPASLTRKASLAALTQTSLASIPDVGESYTYQPALSSRPSSRHNMVITTPGKPSGGDVDVGDAVDVPGNMQGTVRFVGPVQGKKGTFAGVELDAEFAARGKNSGDVDGVSYFSTSIPGAGIFLPVVKAVRRDSTPAYPMTPSTSNFKASQSSSWTPPTPGLPKFSASVGPGARAPSPQGKRAPRTSLPRPDSPVRRAPATPGPRPSIGTPAKGASRYGGSPTNRFAQSVRGTAGDPSKKTSQLERKPSMQPRSASALGSFDGDATPVVGPRKTNGSGGSGSSLGYKGRPPSRANGSHDEEVERLRGQLEERDRQLKDQSTTLAEMESSLTELQTLMESGGLGGIDNTEFADKDTTQLRGLLREKNEKISMLTSEFDAHRADFRSTIDALEMASTETERVYEKRIEELTGDIRELESRNVDVDSVASQLKQLEELVQELEEGLEDARRGEAEARGEVEFLRGEVERTRTELRREKEKSGSGPLQSPTVSSSKELEQKEDEIRGLKAIIHSLSRDSVPAPPPEERKPQRPGSLIAGDVIEHKIARDNLERQVAELQSILEQKTNREKELETELEKARVGGGGNNNNNNNTNHSNNHRSSLRDSRDTVVLTRANDTKSPEAGHKRASTLDTMAESDAQSSATENSTLWCEICEASGHDILTCTNMFGPDGSKSNGEQMSLQEPSSSIHLRPDSNDDAHPAPLAPTRSKSPLATPTVKILPNPMDSGPVPGKESGIMDPEKWCAVCERDGHDSVDCPFEDAF